MKNRIRLCRFSDLEEKVLSQFIVRNLDLVAVRYSNSVFVSDSPSAFTDLNTPEDLKKFADQVREVTGGISVGFKMIFIN